MTEEIRQSALSIEAEIIKLRRVLHQFPEKSGCELKTQAILINRLSELDIEIEQKYYKTGFAAIIRGAEKGKTIALRFDMDALEMDELVDCPYKSKHDGLMHACGHDGHMAIGVGCAMVLSKLKHKLKGQVKLIFQPAEEDAVNGGGAQFMIREGILDDEPRVDAILGLHIWPDLPEGKIGSRNGPMMAASDPFEIIVSGSGGHASLPHKCIDPILIASQIVVSLQSIISRNIDPFEAAVVTIGQIHAGTRYNTIPHEAKINGTLRSFNEETRSLIKAHLEAIVKSISVAYGGSGQVRFDNGYPALINAPQLVALTESATGKIFGSQDFVRIQRPASGGEDFAYFALERPAAYLWLGYNDQNKSISPPHSPFYTFDESILKNGIMVLCQSVDDFLKD